MSVLAQQPERSAAAEFRSGARDAFPVVVASGPFALLFGALAVDNGMSVFEATLMSATTYAGASQMVGIELFGSSIAPWMVVLSIFAVNFRHVLYSAAIGPRISRWPVLKQAFGFFFLVDPQYAEAEVKAGRHEPLTFAWYMGMATPIYIFWVGLSAVGAAFGNRISDPQALGIDFLLPIYFFGMVLEFRHRALWLPVVTASAVASMIAYKTVGSPWHVSIGAAAGMMLAAVMPIRERGQDK